MTATSLRNLDAAEALAEARRAFALLDDRGAPLQQTLREREVSGVVILGCVVRDERLIQH